MKEHHELSGYFVKIIYAQKMDCGHLFWQLLWDDQVIRLWEMLISLTFYH